MRIKEIPSNGGLFPTIALPDEDIPTPKLRHFITVIVTVSISTLNFIDQVLG
jgi:hypothetical protein